MRGYPKPAFRIIVAVITACIAAAVCVLVNHSVYTQEIRVQGQLYSRQGAVVTTLPEGSSALGNLECVLHHTQEHPDADLCGRNLDEKYAGNTLYQSDAERNIIFLEDFRGFYIPFVNTAAPTAGLKTSHPAY